MGEDRVDKNILMDDNVKASGGISRRLAENERKKNRTLAKRGVVMKKEWIGV